MAEKLQKELLRKQKGEEAKAQKIAAKKIEKRTKFCVKKSVELTMDKIISQMVMQIWKKAETEHSLNLVELKAEAEKAKEAFFEQEQQDADAFENMVTEQEAIEKLKFNEETKSNALNDLEFKESFKNDPTFNAEFGDLKPEDMSMDYIT